MIDYEKLIERINKHRRNIKTGALKFDDDPRAAGYLMALDDVIVAMDELRICWSIGE